MTTPVLVLAMAGCGAGGASSGAAPTPTPAQTSAPANGSGKPGPAKTPAAAMTSWVTLVLREKYAEACLASSGVAEPGQDPTAVCAKDEVTKTLKSLHDSWAKPGVKLPPQGKVQVDKLSPQGDTVTVPDTAISLDGRPLHDLELIGSSGDTSSFRLTFGLKKVDGAWYVDTWHINV